MPTKIVTVATDELPAELVAMMLNVVSVKVESGVPDMVHVLGLTDAQLGRAVVPDFMPQLVRAEPLLFKIVGTILIADPNVPFLPLAPAKLSVGTAATTERLTTASAEMPAALVALIV